MKKHVIILSVVLGLLMFTLSPLAAQDEPTPPPRPGLGQGPGPQRWLDLTPEQEAKLKDMRNAHQEANKGFMEQQQKMRQELNKLLQDPKAEQNKVEGLIDEMHKFKAEQMKANLKFRKDMEKVFTPEQLEKLKKAKSRFQEMRQSGRFLRRHPGLRRMMGPRGFGFRDGRQPWGMGFRGRGMHRGMFWNW